SRRRHTRCYRDWSSDVCSSDLMTCRGSGVTLESETPSVRRNVVIAIRPLGTMTFPRNTHRTLKRTEDNYTQIRNQNSKPKRSGRSEERRVGKEGRSQRVHAERT